MVCHSLSSWEFLMVSLASADVQGLSDCELFTSMPLQHSSQYHKLCHVLRPSPAFWYCAVIGNEVRINRGQKASVPRSSSFHSEPITGHLSQAHAIFHHTVTAGHMGYKHTLRIQPSVSFQDAQFLCSGCNRSFDADTVFSPRSFEWSCYHAELTRNSSRFIPVALGWNMSQLTKGTIWGLL